MNPPEVNRQELQFEAEERTFANESVDEEPAAATDEAVQEVDYYAALNVEKTATSQEIKEAYKRLCKYLHPDKNQRDAENFIRVNTAYDVLIDPRTRTIYDLLGVKGLQTSWALADKLMTPEEIQRAFERSQRELEEERERQRTQLSGAQHIYVDASHFLFDPVADVSEYFDVGRLGLISMFQIDVTQKVSARISPKTHLEVESTAAVQGQQGQGQCVAGLRHIITDRTWCKVAFGTGILGQLALAHRFDSVTVEGIGSYSLTDGFQWVVGLNRHLTSKIFANLSFRFGSLADLVVVSMTRRTKRHRVTAKIGLGDIQNFSASVTYGYKPSPLTTFEFETGIGGIHALRAVVGCTRVIARKTAVGVKAVVGAATGVAIEVGFERSGFGISIPIILSHEPSPIAVASAVVVPSLVCYVVQRWVLVPIARRRHERKLAELRELRLQVTREKREKMLASLAAMADTVRARRAHEEDVGGLVIDRAWYGVLHGVESEAQQQQQPPEYPRFIDVTDQLQMLVHNSQLHLTAQAKSGMIDFYDPCPGEPKRLLIRYYFHRKLHEVEIGDLEAVHLADPEHEVDMPTIAQRRS